MINNTIDINTDYQREKPVFHALLTPYRSLSFAGFVILIGLVAVICISNAVFYYTLGAWPVAIFLVIDILIFWLAFHLNYRSGKKREEVSVSRDEIIIIKTAANGMAKHYMFNPFWTKFQINRQDEFGITGMVLSSEGCSTSIGSFLNPDDRESFANALNSALVTVKR